MELVSILLFLLETLTMENGLEKIQFQQIQGRLMNIQLNNDIIRRVFLCSQNLLKYESKINCSIKHILTGYLLNKIYIIFSILEKGRIIHTGKAHRENLLRLLLFIYLLKLYQCMSIVLILSKLNLSCFKLFISFQYILESDKSSASSEAPL